MEFSERNRMWSGRQQTAKQRRGKKPLRRVEPSVEWWQNVRSDTVLKWISFP